VKISGNDDESSPFSKGTALALGIVNFALGSWLTIQGIYFLIVIAKLYNQQLVEKCVENVKKDIVSDNEGKLEVTKGSKLDQVLQEYKLAYTTVSYDKMGQRKSDIYGEFNPGVLNEDGIFVPPEYIDRDEDGNPVITKDPETKKKYDKYVQLYSRKNVLQAMENIKLANIKLDEYKDKYYEYTKRVEMSKNKEEIERLQRFLADLESNISQINYIIKSNEEKIESLNGKIGSEEKKRLYEESNKEYKLNIDKYTSKAKSTSDELANRSEIFKFEQKISMLKSEIESLRKILENDNIVPEYRLNLSTKLFDKTLELENLIFEIQTKKINI
jgi:hypothetical protein